MIQASMSWGLENVISPGGGGGGTKTGQDGLKDKFILEENSDLEDGSSGLVKSDLT